jgi:hypothetical protein
MRWKVVFQKDKNIDLYSDKRKTFSALLCAFSLLTVVFLFNSGCGRIWGGITWLNNGTTCGPSPLLTNQLGLAGQQTQGNGITIDTQGNLYATGFTSGSVLGGAQGTQYGAHGSEDVFVSRFSSSGVFQWSSQLGKAGQQTQGYGITIDTQGNLYVTGLTSGSVLGGAQGTQYGAHGFADVFVAKFNSGGVFEWSSQLGIAGQLTDGFGITIDAQGNLYVTGNTFGSVLGGAQGTQYGTFSPGDQDVFVSKFNSSGVFQWSSQLGIAGQATVGFGITIDTQGNLYASGETSGSVLGGAQGTQYGAHGTNDVFVAKFNSSGVFQFSSQLGMTGQVTEGNGITIDTQGNLYVTGQTAGSVLGGAQGTQYGTHGTDDVFISKFNSSGVFQFSSQLGIAGQQTQGVGITIDTQGNLYVTGYTLGSVLGGAQGTQYGTFSPGDTDAFVSKFNSSGVFEWSSQLGQSGQTTFGSGITIDSCNNLYASGYTSGTIGVQYGTHGVDDVLNFTITPTGVIP